MRIILTKGVSPDEINTQIKANTHLHKKHNFEKYVGKVKLNKNPLTIQKEMRDEWE